jgi:predicted transcriptional regulator
MHDSLIGVRIDRGMQVEKYIKIYVQPNKNADNQTIKELANQNSHQNLAEAWVDIEDPVDDLTMDKIFDALEASAREKGH